MGDVVSLRGATPAEIFHSGIENVAEIEDVAMVVCWKDGRVTAGWSNVDTANLARMILLLDEAQRRRTIDDLYLTRAERDELARTVHPLLATRGVPGTHDPELGCAVIRQMKNLGPGETLKLPRFDKLGDDRLPKSAWPVVTGPVDLVLFEGWCVGSQPVADAARMVAVLAAR